MKKENWFRTLDLVDKKYIEEANPDQWVTPMRKKRIVTTLVACAACLALTLTGLWLFMPYDNTPPSLEHHEKNDYYAVIEELSNLNTEPPKYNNNFDVIVDDIGDLILGGVKGDAADGAVPEMAPGDVPMVEHTNRGDENFEYTTGTYEEITDNQVAGITEADRIKRSSTHIYYLDGNTLKIYNIAGPESKLVGEIALDESANTAYQKQWAFYLSADCKTATVFAKYPNGEKQLCVGVISVDVSNPTKPVEKNRLEITGNYLSSRVIDGKILLMTELVINKKEMDFDKEETFLPQINGESIPADCITVPEEVNAARYTVVIKLDESTLNVEGKAAFLSYTEDIYVSHNHIFLTRVYENVQEKSNKRIRNAMTEITVLSYKDSFEKKGSAVVRGYVKDQWSMDEYEGVLRVVTTTNATTLHESYKGGYTSLGILVTATGDSNASLYCIDLKDFKVVASVEDFAPPREEVQSVRFDKDTAYVCTSIEMSDPVFFFDLSDLNNITYKDTGTIEGFSTSLVNFGDEYLLGIGQENWTTFKAEIYTETKTGVEGFCKYVLEHVNYSTDYKSYYIDRENRLLGLGITDFSKDAIVDYPTNNTVNSRYILLHFDGYNLVELLNVELQGDNSLKRGVYIDSYMYLFGENAFRVEKVF